VEEIKSLREQLRAKEAELLTTKLELLESKIETIQINQNDIENRLRIVEVSRVRFETLAWLAFGSGALSLLNIIARLLNIKV
jgi:hypothetical protein